MLAAWVVCNAFVGAAVAVVAATAVVVVAVVAALVDVIVGPPLRWWS